MGCNTYQGNDPEFNERYGTNDSAKLANMLCTVLSRLESIAIWYDYNIYNALPNNIKEWWKKHKEWDEKTK